MADSEEEDLRQLVSAGDDRGRILGEIFERQRGRLRRMVDLRMDRKLRDRVDPSDVLQESFIEAAARLDAYLEEPGMPIHLWLRFIAGQQLVNHHRHHLGRQKRDAARQLSIDRAGAPEMSSVAMADILMADATTPTGALVREERREQLVAALEEIAPLDREVLVLRHYEQLSNEDVAHVLDLSRTAASNRYMRALRRLRGALTAAGVLEPPARSGDAAP